MFLACVRCPPIACKSSCFHSVTGINWYFLTSRFNLWMIVCPITPLFIWKFLSFCLESMSLFLSFNSNDVSCVYARHLIVVFLQDDFSPSTRLRFQTPPGSFQIPFKLDIDQCQTIVPRLQSSVLTASCSYTVFWCSWSMLHHHLKFRKFSWSLCPKYSA